LEKLIATFLSLHSVELVTKTKAFYCGKPSALIMRYAQRVLGLSRIETCIIGDRMDTE
jgi:NagD protein